jgi:hypothetical protein
VSRFTATKKTGPKYAEVSIFGDRFYAGVVVAAFIDNDGNDAFNLYMVNERDARRIIGTVITANGTPEFLPAPKFLREV